MAAVIKFVPISLFLQALYRNDSLSFHNQVSPNVIKTCQEHIKKPAVANLLSRPC